MKIGRLTLFGLIAMSILHPVNPIIGQEPSEDGSRRQLILGGTALAGAVLGGAIVAITQHSGHHKGERGETGASGSPGPQGVPGPQGPSGPAGLSPFVADVGQALSFNLQADFSLNTDFPVVAFPFIALPNGTIIEGLPVTVSEPTIVNFAPIIISSPLFGTYQAGVNFVPAGVGQIAVAVSGTVAASRDLSTSFLQVPVLPGVLEGQGQISVPFVYNVLNVP